MVIEEKNLGAEHPEVGLTIYSLAEVLARQERYTDAYPKIKRALEFAPETQKSEFQGDVKTIKAAVAKKRK